MKVRSHEIKSKADNLKGLKWVSVASETNLKDEVSLLKESIDHLKLNKENSLIITEYQFINTEIKSKVYSPNRWYTTDGVSYPLKDNKFFSGSSRKSIYNSPVPFS